MAFRLALVITLAAATAANAKPDCSDDAVGKLSDEAVADYQQGNYPGALAASEKVLQCRPTDEFWKTLIGLSACKAHQFPRAKQIYRQLAQGHAKNNVHQVCLMNGFDPT